MFEPNVKLNRFEENYVKRYESEPAPKGRILFYGPSNFTRWAPRWNNPRLEDEILMKDGSPACLNRAFGGSCVEEQLYYYPRLVRPCAPRALVLSAFGNHASQTEPAVLQPRLHSGLQPGRRELFDHGLGR